MKTKISLLGEYLCIDADIIYESLLRYSDSMGLKLIHFEGGERWLPTFIYDMILSVYGSIDSYKFDYDYIVQNSCKTVPIDDNGYVYFLINNGNIIYVGQSNCLVGRIYSHKLDKVFDYVFTIQVPANSMSLLEYYYINKIKPYINLAGINGSVIIDLILSMLNKYQINSFYK